MAFWLLTLPEFTALKRVYEAARGIKPPLTKEESENLAFNQRYILDQQIRAHNRKIESQKMKLVRSANGG
jgi:hypothetical protein